MTSIVKSICLHGLEGVLINVETDVSAGMPCFEIVGLADTNIKESKERVRTAIKNCNIELASRKYIINLSPANLRKEGAILDLAIAVGILKSIGALKQTDISKTIFLGEISLNGKINGVKGILPICLEAKRMEMKRMIIPKTNVREASLVDGIEIIGLDSLKEVIDYLNEKIHILPSEHPRNISTDPDYDVDFSDVKGQYVAKRVLEISASGGHSFLFVGAPGSGKTMMINRLKTILPELSFEEAIEITKIHSIGGILDNSTIISKRPFRNPHHSITKTALIGGGKIPKPGEISFAHTGVLYLDELLEFKRETLESLRMPLEDKKISINRLEYLTTFPSNFILAASMNPCPCGYYGSGVKDCTCTESQRNKYISKLSGPLFDRFDMQIDIPYIKYEEYKEKIAENSCEIRKRVNRTRRIQRERYANEEISLNSDLTPKLINKHCKLDAECEDVLEKTCTKLKVSTRGLYKIIKISRTIADMEESKEIKKSHILEAIQYRKKEKNEI